jgi:hypothetical protein
MIFGVNTKYDQNGLLKFVILYYQTGDGIETFEIHYMSCILFTARPLWSTEVILIGQSVLFNATYIVILLSDGWLGCLRIVDLRAVSTISTVADTSAVSASNFM